MLKTTENGIVIMVSDDGDGTFEVHLAAHYMNFSGHSRAWIDRDELKRFVKCCSQFPLPSGTAASLASATWKQASEVAMKEEQLLLRVSQFDSKGRILAVLDLRSPEASSNSLNVSQRVHLEIVTEYVLLGSFAKELSQAISQGGGSAHLAAIDNLPDRA